MTVLVLVLTLAAPLPAPRVPTLSCGTYELVWQGVRYTAVFAERGHYEAGYGDGMGTRWAGTWHVKGGILHVGESVASPSIIPPASPTHRWTLKLPVGPDGTIASSPATITLRRLTAP